MEPGIKISKGRRHAEASFPALLEDTETNLSGILRRMVAQLMSELRQLYSQIAEIDATIVRGADQKMSALGFMGQPGSRQTLSVVSLSDIEGLHPR